MADLQVLKILDDPCVRFAAIDEHIFAIRRDDEDAIALPNVEEGDL